MTITNTNRKAPSVPRRGFLSRIRRALMSIILLLAALIAIKYALPNPVDNIIRYANLGIEQLKELWAQIGNDHQIRP